MKTQNPLYKNILLLLLNLSYPKLLKQLF